MCRIWSQRHLHCMVCGKHGHFVKRIILPNMQFILYLLPQLIVLCIARASDQIYFSYSNQFDFVNPCKYLHEWVTCCLFVLRFTSFLLWWKRRAYNIHFRWPQHQEPPWNIFNLVNRDLSRVWTCKFSNALPFEIWGYLVNQMHSLFYGYSLGILFNALSFLIAQ